MPDLARAQATWPQDFTAKLNRRTIPGLDGIRALAVLLVISGHFGLPVLNAALGVLIFFVLSGFLITWLMLKEVDRTGSVSLRNFYKRRMLRIFPAFYAFWLSSIVIYLVRGHGIHWGEAISALFYYSNYYLGLVKTGSSQFPHTWSLSIEEQFYLLWPFLFILGKGSLPRLSRILAGTVVLVWIHRAVLFLVFGVPQEYLYRAFDTRMDHLAIGCLLAVMLKRGALMTVSEVLCRRIWYPALTLAVLLGLQTFHDSAAFIFVFGYAIEPLLTAVFLLQLIWWSESGAWRIFENPVVRYLGRISYPLYLWQQLTLYTSRHMTEQYPLIVQFVFALGVTVAFASASYYIVEKPFLKLKSRF